METATANGLALGGGTVVRAVAVNASKHAQDLGSMMKDECSLYYYNLFWLKCEPEVVLVVASITRGNNDVYVFQTFGPYYQLYRVINTHFRRIV